MGYICPDCGEGLPEDTPCPCTMAGDDYDDAQVITGPLTAEIENPRSPVRQFLDERFTAHLRDIQRAYRENPPPLAVPSVPRSDADPGTVGTAADWLLKFLVHPQPNLDLAMVGATLARSAGIDLARALPELADQLGVTLPRSASPVQTFTGPVLGSTADAGMLGSCCWALALLTEVYRRGPMAAAAGPLAQFRGRRHVSADELLSLAPPRGLDQLARFRHVFETALLPQLAVRTGTWALGPTFTGSALINADADLIAGGLLLDLKTSAKKLSLAVHDVFQLIGYALLDFDDQYCLNELGIFSARYAYLITWPLGAMLDELAGHEVNLRAGREEFQQLLLAYCRA